jgi:hypothetical protein
MMYYSIPFSFAKTEQISQGIFVSFYGGKCSRESSSHFVTGLLPSPFRLPPMLHELPVLETGDGSLNLV